jgi:hypothetical protein
MVIPFYATSSKADPKGEKEGVNPLKLRGLAQAAFILFCFEMGVQEFEIIKKVKGDYGLVKMWLSFLLHNHYMAKEFHPDVCFIYSVTEKEKNSLIDIPSWPTKLF